MCTKAILMRVLSASWASHRESFQVITETLPGCKDPFGLGCISDVASKTAALSL